jgi:hypothetical protein
MTTLTQEQKDKVSQLINDLAGDFKELVTTIEAKPETTQHHYGDYGGVISQFSHGKPGVAKIIAAALIKAGANADGVNNGLNLLVLGRYP